MGQQQRRQIGVGAVAGLSGGLLAAWASLALTGAFFAGTGAGWPGYLLSAALLGMFFCGVAQQTARLERFLVALVCALVIWILFPLIFMPLLAGQGPRWHIEGVIEQLPLLSVYLLQGLLLPILTGLLDWIVERVFGIIEIEPPAADTSRPAPQHIVILGGGFAGVTTAQCLERLLSDDEHISVTLASATNYMLFTPMLAEVTAGSVEAQHICPPLRAFFHRVRVIHDEPASVNTDHRHVTLKSGVELNYDHLVLALGAVPNYFGNSNLERHTFSFKSLADALHLRAHTIRLLEQADKEPDRERRKALLTFVIAGAGFAGVELAGALNDFVRGSLWYYPQIDNDDVTLLLVYSGAHTLPELSLELATYAEEKMAARGVTLRPNSRVTDAAPGRAFIDGVSQPAETLIWTAGNLPNPILQTFGGETNQHGAVVTDTQLRVQGLDRVWAVGDCAAVPDVVTGKFASQTAQYAQREARTLAHNLHAVLQGKEPKVFRHVSQGMLAVVGHQTACAEVFGLKFSGLFAWLLWRGIYIAKLPTLEKKVRVLLDWLIDVFFPRDITYIPITDEGELRSRKLTGRK
jgi:NADH:ubiquinone reductase (H+-translocating)